MNDNPKIFIVLKFRQKLPKPEVIFRQEIISLEDAYKEAFKNGVNDNEDRDEIENNSHEKRQNVLLDLSPLLRKGARLVL